MTELTGDNQIENITNANIHEFVKSYLDNRNSLPTHLQDKSISDWDVSLVTSMESLFEGYPLFNESLDSWNVSNVTNMEAMFNGCESFNQPLSGWNVSNVTNMRMMFFGCESFNQPLNGWNVGNVTNMEAMFSGCFEFNQPLNDWTVSNVTDMTGMFNLAMSFDQPLNNWDINNVTGYREIFEDSAISDENRPNFIEQVPEVIVDPYEIHKAAAKINYKKLNDILKEFSGVPARPEDLDFPTFINESILGMIDASQGSDIEKENKRNGLNLIMTQRLDGFRYGALSPLLLDSVYYALHYVAKQSSPFKDSYVDTFIQDCTQAYNGTGEDALSCAAGALERVAMSLVTPCQMLTSSGTDESRDIIEQCKMLTAIISYSPNILVVEYIKDWYKLHTEREARFPAEVSTDDRKQNLKAYLLEKLPGEETLIEGHIEGLDYEDDDFDYNGGKRRTRRYRKNGKKQTKKKRQTKKKKRTNKRKQTKKN